MFHVVVGNNRKQEKQEARLGISCSNCKQTKISAERLVLIRLLVIGMKAEGTAETLV